GEGDGRNANIEVHGKGGGDVDEWQSLDLKDQQPAVRVAEKEIRLAILGAFPGLADNPLDTDFRTLVAGLPVIASMSWSALQLPMLITRPPSFMCLAAA